MGKYLIKVSRSCLICDSLFLPSSNNQKFCTDCKTKECIICKRKYNASNKRSTIENSKFCSQKCYLRSRFYKGKCKNCGRECELSYCSNKCMKDYWNKNSYRLNGKKRQWEQKMSIITYLGGKCKNCGISDVRVLEVNHIDRTKKHRTKYYTLEIRLREWKNNLENLELLCANCHRIHTWEQMGYGKI